MSNLVWVVCGGFAGLAIGVVTVWVFGMTDNERWYKKQELRLMKRGLDELAETIRGNWRRVTGRR
jgi:hypothetical protein